MRTSSEDLGAGTTWLADAGDLALRDVAQAVDLHTAALHQLTGQQLDDHKGLSDLELTVIAQRQMIDALQRRCEDASAALDELRTRLTSLRGLVRTVESAGLQ